VWLQSVAARVGCVKKHVNTVSFTARGARIMHIKKGAGVIIAYKQLNIAH